MPTASTWLVCFDLGGVVIRIHRDWAGAIEAAGLSVRDASALATHGQELAALSARYQSGRMRCEGYAKAVSETLAGLYTPSEIGAIHRAIIRELYPGVTQLIAGLRARGIATAALSNTNATHWQQVSGWSVFAHFDHVVLSHAIGAVKPDAAAYDAVQRQTGTAAANILFFDDVQAHVDAARALGWHAEQINPDAAPAVQVEAHLRRYGILDSPRSGS